MQVAQQLRTAFNRTYRYIAISRLSSQHRTGLDTGRSKLCQQIWIGLNGFGKDLDFKRTGFFQGGSQWLAFVCGRFESGCRATKLFEEWDLVPKRRIRGRIE